MYMCLLVSVTTLGIMSDGDVMGIIIITVVCCAVGTSVVWVVIIYQTRKRMAHHPALESSHQEAAVLEFTDKPMAGHFEDNTSDQSSCKDSGTGDSAKRSNENLAPGEEYTLIINGNVKQLCDVFVFVNRECEILGMASNTSKGLPARTASLVYLVTDGNNSHTPLLHREASPSAVKQATNHDRLEEPDPVVVVEDSKPEDAPSEDHIQ